MNPSGLCLCGCGGKTKIATCTYRKRGWVKGEPVDYIHGHYGAMALRWPRETMQARRRRTQKQGPYKAGQTMKAKVVADKIEAAMRRRG